MAQEVPMNSEKLAPDQECSFCGGSGVVCRWNANGPVDENDCPFCKGTGAKPQENNDG